MTVTMADRTVYTGVRTMLKSPVNYNRVLVHYTTWKYPEEGKAVPVIRVDEVIDSNILAVDE